jgi:hypothetical protein
VRDQVLECDEGSPRSYHICMGDLGSSFSMDSKDHHFITTSSQIHLYMRWQSLEMHLLPSP